MKLRRGHHSHMPFLQMKSHAIEFKSVQSVDRKYFYLFNEILKNIFYSLYFVVFVAPQLI